MKGLRKGVKGWEGTAFACARGERAGGFVWYERKTWISGGDIACREADAGGSGLRVLGVPPGAGSGPSCGGVSPRGRLVLHLNPGFSPEGSRPSVLAAYGL